MTFLGATHCLVLWFLFAFVNGAPPATNASLGHLPANLTTLGDLKSFRVPGTKTTLTFSDWGSLLSQTETDLCVVEGLGAAFASVVASKKDGFLPRNKFVQKYGNVEIMVQDYSQPAFRMTYGVVTNMLRGIALFMSMYGYYEMGVSVYDSSYGHVGAGGIKQASKIVPADTE
ncbi:MAG: hypothetical protein Q9191_004697 [Dirinaria sp. TL-2023a]